MIVIGATGMESNLQPAPYESAALPFELRWRRLLSFQVPSCSRNWWSRSELNRIATGADRCTDPSATPKRSLTCKSAKAE